MPTRYRIAESLPQACSFLDLNIGRVLRRAGLPEDWLDQTRSDVDGPTLFRLWSAIGQEADNPDAVMRVAQSYAHGPFVPPVLAFSSAETVYVGLQRLAVFKPLIAPMEMRVSRDGRAARIELVSTLSDPGLPGSLERFELIYLTECARTFTGRAIKAHAVEFRHHSREADNLTEFFSVSPEYTGRTVLSFTPEDADLPLISRSPTLWETLEPGLTQQLEERTASHLMATRVRRMLADCLPGGCTTAEEMARRLNVSKRSLQRRLSEEGTSFQTLLNEVRAEMSERYLRQSNLSVPEISHLLGFRDTSSFFRAFQGWTGTTPGSFRAEIGQRLH